MTWFGWLWKTNLEMTGLDELIGFVEVVGTIYLGACFFFWLSRE